MSIDSDHTSSTPTLSEPIEGWRRIAMHLSHCTGLDISPDSAIKWAQRAEDPLPVRKFGSCRRPRVVAEVGALEAWADRQWIGEEPAR